MKYQVGSHIFETAEDADKFEREHGITDEQPSLDPKRSDSQRIDWLEKHYLPVNNDSCRETVKCGLLGVTFDAPHATLRAAIDAAMDQEYRRQQSMEYPIQ